MSAVKGLLDSAFRQGPAIEANTLIEETRQLIGTKQGHALNYEVSLIDPEKGPDSPAGRGWVYLDQVVAPRLALFLKAKRLSVADCAPAFISLFWGDQIYFIHAADFFEFIRQARGLDQEALPQWPKPGKEPANPFQAFSKG